MIRRDALLLGLAALFASATSSLALDRPLTPEENQLILDISTHNSAIRSMAGRFLQIDTEGTRTEGTFYLVRPSKIRFRYNPPSHQEIVSNGRGFYVLDRQDKTYYAYPQQSVPLRQFLGDQIDFSKSNVIDVTTTETYLTLTITDDTVAGTVEVSLIFDKDSKELMQWTLVNPNGTELTFSLYDVQKDVKIPDAYFGIDATYNAVDPQS